MGDKRVLSVSNLTRNVNEEHLQEIFGNYGKVKETTLAVDKAVGLPKGYAYVEYESESHAEKAVAGLHGGQIDGNIIKVEFQGDKKKKANDENKRPGAQPAARRPPARPETRDRDRRSRDRDRRDRSRSRRREPEKRRDDHKDRDRREKDREKEKEREKEKQKEKEKQREKDRERE